MIALRDHSELDRPSSAIVMGGGLAGIAAAIALAERGCRVTLVETRQRLGGRATSFNDPVTGDLLDNCQHVLLGCCTALIDLYQRLGVLDLIQWHQRLYFRDAAGHLDVLEADDLPAPFHMIRALIRFQGLSVSDKLAISRGMLGIMRAGRQGRRELAHVSFRDWLVQHGQPQSVIDRFWAVIVISACNEQLDRVAARYALQVFQDGFLNHERSYVMGLAAAPLVRLYDPAQAIIERAGGRVLLSHAAEQLICEGQRATSLLLARGSKLEAQAFVSALPFDRLARILPAHVVQQDPRLAGLNKLTVSPIIGIHLYFDRVVTTLPHLVLMDSPLQWIFNKGGADGESPPGQHLHGVISAAHDVVDWPAESIAALAEREIRKALNVPVAARVTHQRVIKEKRATFSIAPGCDLWRPRAITTAPGSVRNLVLAGDWTDTGWPATMEGAVRSGYLAATALWGDRDALLPPELPDRPLYRLIAGR